jgi:para-aminobenzoate synthetase/4-amino-4-deoxychorismate lyase
MSGSANPAWLRLRNPGSVWIDDPDGSILYLSPREVLTARAAGEIPELLKRADLAVSAGFHVAGFFAYDAGTPDFSWPLAWLGVYDSPLVMQEDPPLDVPLSNGPDNGRGTFSLRKLPARMHDRFVRSVSRIRGLIESGIVYQVNYTERLRFEFSGDALSLYLCMRQLQHGRYAAFVNTGDAQILSVSPELFLDSRAEEGPAPGYRLETQPMKGTVSAGRGEQALRTQKNLSENYMIVDLMRNDLGRVCKPGTVKVSAAAEITALSTALQMTSTVRGFLPGGPFFERVWPALFPAGSITGAPKRSAMRVISEMEEPRGVYTGAIGHASSSPRQVQCCDSHPGFSRRAGVSTGAAAALSGNRIRRTSLPSSSSNRPF